MTFQNKSTRKRTTVWLCTTAMLMAVNVAMSSFGVPVPGGHLYLNDIVICLAAIILDPFAAFMVGGVGAFLGVSAADVCLSRHTRTAGGGDLAILSLCDEKASDSFLRYRRCDRCGHYGRGLFAGQGVPLQHPRICPPQAALSDFAGGCGRGVRNDSLLAMQTL